MKIQPKVLTLSILLALGAAPAASAQQTDSDKQKNDDNYNLGTVAVVGTRGKYRTVNDAPVPVDILEAEDLKTFTCRHSHIPRHGLGTDERLFMPPV